MAASAMGFGPFIDFSVFIFFNFCETSYWSAERSIYKQKKNQNYLHVLNMLDVQCSVFSVQHLEGLTWGACIVFGFIERRFVYNFGALLNTTGVGSEQYDFSGMASEL